ncbi:MAG: ABC transporter ATP-binding protein [Proteobacteria bacterium]|nr:ABC transporter ATP-binding protein [Pseudomonadota bacterium]
MSEILAIENVTKRFGGLLANQNISFSVSKGEIIGLIGPNGAGKSTLFNCIACFYRADGGRILFNGIDITHKNPESICTMGMGRTFQIVRIFKGMTVLENIMVGVFLRHINRKDAETKAKEIAALFGFSGKLDLNASSLTISDQKRLEVARIFATGSELLLLDEMMAGLNIHEVRESVELVLKLKSLGLTLILVEHVMEGIMPISDRVIVLDYGEKIAEGPPNDIVNDERVIKAYLGEKYYAKHRESRAKL